MLRLSHVEPAHLPTRRHLTSSDDEASEATSFDRLARHGHAANLRRERPAKRRASDCAEENGVSQQRALNRTFNSERFRAQFLAFPRQTTRKRGQLASRERPRDSDYQRVESSS